MAAALTLKWESQAAFSARVVRGDRQLIVFVKPHPDDAKWFVISIEASNDEAALENHAHKVIGNYPSIVKAFEAAESFARAWVKKFKATKHEACECEEIEK